MRVVIIVLVVIAVAFAFVAVQGGLRSDGTADVRAPKQKNGKIDEDALNDWRPPNFAKLIADITAPFAPKLELPNPRITLAPGGSDSRMVPASSSDMRVSRIELTSGGGLRVEYACLPRNGRRCPQAACICSPHSVFTPQQVLSCPDAWAKRRIRGNTCIEDPDDPRASLVTTLVVYPEPGTLTFTALGTSNVTAQMK